jgi:hypothetical protein
LIQSHTCRALWKPPLAISSLSFSIWAGFNLPGSPL